MANLLTLQLATMCCIALAIAQRPPETILASESHAPDVRLSLVQPEHPHEGDEIQLECSAKPKNSSSYKPEGVHWIKGKVGVPNAGSRPGSERYVREQTEDKAGVVVFTLTIRDAEPTDTDKYMCIVQVGKTGYFTSNELPIEIIPSLDKNGEKIAAETITDETTDIDEILKWKERVTDLSQEELNKLADAMKRDEERKRKVKPSPSKEDDSMSQKDDLLSLTPEERNILARKNAIEDMSESELMLLGKALRKEKTIKQEKDLERKRREEESAKAKDELSKKQIENLESVVLNTEEKGILERKSEIADMSDEELKILSVALKKERDIKQQEKHKGVKKDSDNDLTDEERDILKRKDQISDMLPAELKIMSRALTKQKRIQDAIKKPNSKIDSAQTAVTEEQLTEAELNILARKNNMADMSQEELTSLAHAMKKETNLLKTKEEATKPSVKVPSHDEMTEEEMNAILSRRDKLNEMTQDDLNLLTKALTKERLLKEERRKQRGLKPSDLEDEMSEEEMREILKLKDADSSMLTQQDIVKLGKLLLKEQKMKDKKQKSQNDPLEGEVIKDEL